MSGDTSVAESRKWYSFIYFMRVVGTDIYKVGWTKARTRMVHPVEDRRRRLTKRCRHDLRTKRFALVVLEFSAISGQPVETDCHTALSAFHIRITDLTVKGRKRMTEYYRLTIAEADATRLAIRRGQIPTLHAVADGRKLAFTTAEFVDLLPNVRSK